MSKDQFSSIFREAAAEALRSISQEKLDAGVSESEIIKSIEKIDVSSPMRRLREMI